jgi:riboflavin biosynthesis pyrimidine reductase
VPLPEALAQVYGNLSFPKPDLGRAFVAANFVSSLDGVVSLESPGKAGGGPISGNDPWDRLVMAMLRACADVVMEGAGTFREAPGSLLSAEDLAPQLGGAFLELRNRLKKPPLPLRVIVSQHGDLDLSAPLFQKDEGRVMVLTRPPGLWRMYSGLLPSHVEVRSLEGHGPLGAREILKAISLEGPPGFVLLEGGPQLFGSFIADQQLDELFLTLAPQISGRDFANSRPGLVKGKAFAPWDLRWARLLSIKRSESHLFLRYAFPKGV